MPPGDINESLPRHGTVASLDAEVVQIADAIGQRARRLGLIQGAVQLIPKLTRLVRTAIRRRVTTVALRATSRVQCLRPSCYARLAERVVGKVERLGQVTADQCYQLRMI
jgi:hypothetical protein